MAAYGNRCFTYICGNSGYQACLVETFHGCELRGRDKFAHLVFNAVMSERIRPRDLLFSEVIGAGYPVIVMHGARLDHHHMLDAIEPVFERQGSWQRHYIDLPGHGQSETSTDWSAQDDILNVLIEHIKKHFGSRRIAVIGESRGSYLAQGLVYRIPEQLRGVALIVPGGNAEEAKAKLPKHEVRDSLEIPPQFSTPEEQARYDRLVVQSESILIKIRSTKIPALGLADADLEARISDNYFFSFDDQMKSARFEGPSLIIAGRQDSIAGFQDALALLPNFSKSTFGLLDCAGHSLGWERPELFKALVRDWLSRMEQEQ
jgi:pimeloyl-ACP methyl ester carboxylesterase